MDLYGLLTLPVVVAWILGVAYLVCLSNNQGKKKNGFYSHPDWNFILKKQWATYVLKKWKKSQHNEIKLIPETEEPLELNDDLSDTQCIFGSNKDGVSLYISFTRKAHRMSEVILILTLPNGDSFQLPNHETTMVYDGSSESWRAADLSLIMLEPFKRWRILFNGLLSKVNSTPEEILQHVRLNFIWIAASAPVRIPDDSSEVLLAEALATEPWKDPFWMSGITHSSKKGYDQYGALSGIIRWNDIDKPQEVFLCGLRKRRWQPELPSLRRILSIDGMGTDGTVYQIEVESFMNGLSQVKYGSVRDPTGNSAAIDSVDIDMATIGEKFNVPKSFSVNFTAQSDSYSLFLSLNKKETKHYKGGQPISWESFIIPFQAGINGIQGSGYLRLWYKYDKATYPTEDNSNQISLRQLHWLSIEDIDSKIPICSTFKDRVSKCPQVVGGKGASLALLSSYTSSDYSVPEGFCLTTRGLDIQIEHNPVLSEAIKSIEEVNINYNETALKENCARTSHAFESTSIYNLVEEHVELSFDKLLESCQNKSGDLYFAVRSSGIGEDSDELSAAGQNTTILGCKTIGDVLRGIQQCWASLFTFQSVEYRRQHGQPVNCGMGVVIQVLVEADAAGVMFTRHPNNGNPANILITSNYGFGESVVSGMVEPDSIVLEKDIRNNIKIKNIQMGRKEKKILLNKSDKTESGTQTMELEVKDVNSLSISTEECLLLGKIAILQEALWGSARDIEWAIVKGKIYLVQARPITSLNNWTEFELCHELDSPIMSDEDLLTFANTGEVLPGATSPLSISILGGTLDKAISYVSENAVQDYYFCSLACTHHRMGVNVMNTMFKTPEKNISLRNKTVDLSIFGHIVTDENMNSIGIRRQRNKVKFAKLILFKNIITFLWKNNATSVKAKLHSENLKINLKNGSSSLEMYSVINNSLPELLLSCNYHGATSTASTFSQIVLFSVLLEGKSDFSTETYQDIALILSSCSDVISADIPASLKKIALAIKLSGKREKFCEQKSENGYAWMKENLPDVSKMFSSFLERHGHRCIREFDLLSDTWGLNPTPVIETLQATVNVVSDNDTVSSPNTAGELVSRLVTPVSNGTRTALKFIIPMCQKSVERRETSKSSLILIAHKLRLAYYELGKQMVKEWLLPDFKLICFMTHTEIGRYIKSRNPKYLNKATLRKRFYPKWDKLQFPELVWGVPNPITSNEDALHKGGNGIKVVGTPVCSGDIVGRACVINELSEIHQLQHGDILITHSTDIGWSPYFPLLGGVVTELGGLISHGAVVAREYGLPCIVGAQGATNSFKTGDAVQLSASLGVLERVEKVAQLS